MDVEFSFLILGEVGYNYNSLHWLHVERSVLIDTSPKLSAATLMAIWSLKYIPESLAKEINKSSL